MPAESITSPYGRNPSVSDMSRKRIGASTRILTPCACRGFVVALCTLMRVRESVPAQLRDY
jgi:hypothetical protein